MYKSFWYYLISLSMLHISRRYRVSEFDWKSPGYCSYLWDVDSFLRDDRQCRKHASVVFSRRSAKGRLMQVGNPEPETATGHSLVRLAFVRANDQLAKFAYARKGKSYRCSRLTLRAAVGLAGLLRYAGVEGWGMGRRLIAAGRSCSRMRGGSRRGRRGRRYRLLGLLGLLHVAGGRGCYRGGAIATAGATSHGATGWLLLLQRRLLLLLLLRRLLRRRRFLRVRFAHCFYNKGRIGLEY